VIVEGILYVSHYGDMLSALSADHRGMSRFYYLDVSFEETLVLLGSEASRQAVLPNRCSSEHLTGP
jgi:hypothetical protein